MNRIKSILTHNIALKALSLVIALVIWILVVNISKPEITDTKTVTLEVHNKNVFEKEGKSWQIDRNTVSVSYRVRSDVRQLISAADFRAYVDLNDYSITGSCPIYLEVLNDREQMIAGVASNPTVAHISIENIQEKHFDVGVRLRGRPKNGYSTAGTIISPESVYVVGPESEIGRISSVGIEINVNGLSSNTAGAATPVYYDANGNVIDIRNVTATTSDINYTVNFHKEKEVNLTCPVIGTPDAGYQYESMTISPQSIRLAASPTVIDNLNVFELPGVNIAGAKADITVPYDITGYLPKGVTIGEASDEKVVVTVRITKLPDVLDKPMPITPGLTMPTGLYPGKPEESTAEASKPANKETTAEETVKNNDKETTAGGPSASASDPTKETRETKESEMETTEEIHRESTSSYGPMQKPEESTGETVPETAEALETGAAAG